jgi:hypothetical protein
MSPLNLISLDNILKFQAEYTDAMITLQRPRPMIPNNELQLR